MLILGLDLSSALTGWSIVDHDKNLIAYGKIELSKYKKKKFPLEWVKVLYNELIKIMAAHKVDEVIIEATFSRNVMTLKSLAKCRGIAEAACVNAGVNNIAEINTLSARKRVFGKGKLTKEECFEILKSKFPNQDFYNDGLDISDSIVVALAKAME